MTNSGEELLTAGEGVDEGSAASTAEEEPTVTGSAPAGSPPRGHGDAQPAPPDEVDTADSRTAREADPGQQFSAGEG